MKNETRADDLIELIDDYVKETVSMMIQWKMSGEATPTPLGGSSRTS